MADPKFSSPSVGHSDLLGRIARSGSWEEQARTSFALIDDHIANRRFSDALHLVPVCVEECRICYGVLRQWQADIGSLLVELGRSQEWVDRARAQHEAAIETNGNSYASALAWSAFRDLVLDLQRDLVAEDATSAAESAKSLFAAWRTIAAAEADLSCAIIDLLVAEEGETILPRMWERILGPLFEWRYLKFDTARRDWVSEILPELVYVALEAERTWLSTPGQSRDDIAFVEFEDRFEMSFDPCGTGGRALLNSRRAAEAGGAPSTSIIEGAYDWTDGKRGVCSYCNHCQVLMEHLPMDHFGYPLRVVEPPQHIAGESTEHARCKWTMYKDPHAAPDEVFTRCGREKPARESTVPIDVRAVPDGVWIGRDETG